MCQYQPERAFQYTLQTIVGLVDRRRSADSDERRRVSHLRAGFCNGGRDTNLKDQKGRDEKLLGRVSAIDGRQCDERSALAVGHSKRRDMANAVVGYESGDLIIG